MFIELTLIVDAGHAEKILVLAFWGLRARWMLLYRIEMNQFKGHLGVKNFFFFVDLVTVRIWGKRESCTIQLGGSVT